jgi:CDP-diacylglycerol--serine O-phosphatidyltransferase
MRKNIILPNMVTLLGLLSGVYSLVAVMQGKFFVAAVAILLAAVFDGLDGKVARLVDGASEFGIQLDSLADVISFGVAPAVLLYQWQMAEFRQLGIMAMFLFVACGALRLARFNVQTKKISSLFFVGLPIPAAAAIIASGVIFVYRIGYWDHPYMGEIAIVFALLFAFLMVSTVPYYSFKNLSFLRTRPFNTIVILVIFLFVIGIEPRITIFGFMMAYVVSGFIMLPLRARIVEKLERSEETDEAN